METPILRGSESVCLYCSKYSNKKCSGDIGLHGQICECSVFEWDKEELVIYQKWHKSKTGTYYRPKIK